MIFIFSFLIKIITSVFSSLTRKILILFIIFLLIHATIEKLTNSVNGSNISYGTALGTVTKTDINFILTNIGNILSYIWSNMLDFIKSLNK